MLTRFAPSPTGYLHLGHARSAFEVWHAADAQRGRVLLRLEDIDQTRCKPHYAAAILEDLAWLGLKSDGPVRRQSDHFGDYSKIIHALWARGLVYRCFLTRSASAIRLASPVVNTGLPPDIEAARLEKNEPFAWRLSLRAARRALGKQFYRLHFTEWRDEVPLVHLARPEVLGDVVLARKDAPAAYHLACCHDDALQEVTHVIRGEDLREATHIHVLLQALMDWPAPVYRFHSLITAGDGRKLAKRDGDKALRDYRAEGVTPDEIKAMSGAP